MLDPLWALFVQTGTGAVRAPVLSKDPEVSVQCTTQGACRATSVITRENQQSAYIIDADTDLQWSYPQSNKTEVLTATYRFDDSSMSSAYSFEYYPDDVFYHRAVLQTPYLTPHTTARRCAAGVGAYTVVDYYNGDIGSGRGNRWLPPTSRAAAVGSC